MHISPTIFCVCLLVFSNRLVLCDLMESDLHQIIVSPQKLSEDHVKVFIYQILRGMWRFQNHSFCSCCDNGVEEVFVLLLQVSSTCILLTLSTGRQLVMMPCLHV